MDNPIEKRKPVFIKELQEDTEVKKLIDLLESVQNDIYNRAIHPPYNDPSVEEAMRIAGKMASLKIELRKQFDGYVIC